MPAVAEPLMAKKKTSAKAMTSTRLNAELVHKAKIVAVHKNITIGDYLESLLRGPIEKDYEALMARFRKGD